MDLTKDILTQIREMNNRLRKLESANQVQKIVANGTTIIDTHGLNSLNNFARGQLLNASSPTVNSGSYTDVPGSTLNSFTLSRQANVLIYFTIDGYMNNFNTTNQEYLNIAFVDNGVTVLQDMFVTGNLFFDGTDFWVGLEFASTMQFVSLAAGTHQFNLRARIDNFQTGDTALLQNWVIGYIIFGE